MPIDEGHQPLLDQLAHDGDWGREAPMPLIGVDVMYQADTRPPPPQWREERHAILNVDDDIGPFETGQANHRSRQVLGEGASGVDDRVVAVLNWTSTDQRHLMALLGQPGKHSVD